MPFDLDLVPVAHEHCVDVVHKVGNGKHDVSASQPVPVRREETVREATDFRLKIKVKTRC